MLLLERLNQLENEIKNLKLKLTDLSKGTENKQATPFTLAGSSHKTLISPVDIITGYAMTKGGSICWNNSELDNPPFNAEPALPTVGYHKHSHSRYNGGPLIKQVLEIAEYNAADWTNITNPYCPQWWQTTPKYAIALNSKDENVNKIGKLDLIFNPDGGYDTTDPNNPIPIGTWGVATYEINVQKCYFVKRRTTDEESPSTGKIGDIELDANGNEMKSLLYIENSDGTQDTTQSSIIWDKNGNGGLGCWRLLAVYASGV